MQSDDCIILYMCTAKRVDNLAKKYHMLQFKRLLVFLVVTENPWRRHLILCNKSLSETLTQLTQHPLKKPSTDLGTLEVVLCDLQLSSPKKPWTRKSQHFFWVAEVGGGRVRTWRQKPGCHFHTFSFSGVLLKACECSVVFHLWSKFQHLSNVKRLLKN